MCVRHYILATAGHVDHGKSALVKALTGTDPDRLPEEKARGITIDLGFAHFELSTLDLRPSTFSVGIVDVPGHEDFVKNMVAGVGSIDLALFVVAADDGWMPQTEEHLQILTYLGVARAVVALTKIDLARGKEAELTAALRARLQNSPFASAPIVPTSTVTGQGLDQLKGLLTQVLAGTPPPPDLGKPRLPIDRVFVLKGIGTVVTGTLSGGTLRRGQVVSIQPTGLPGRVRSVHSHMREVESTGPGTRTALNLPDLEARGDGREGGLARGDVVTLPELGGASDTVDVVLERLARGDSGLDDGTAPRGDRPTRIGVERSRPLKHATLVRVHHGSANHAARVLFREAAPLLVGERALAELRFEEPVAVFAGDRFIVRDWSEQTTLAGGLVLDPEADRKRWRSEAQAEFLRQRLAAPEDPQAWIASQLERDRVASRAQFLVKSRFSAAQVSAAIDTLAARGELVLAEELVARRSWWDELRGRAEQTVDATHRAHPERTGLALSELRVALCEAQTAGVFEALLAELVRHGFQQVGNAIRRAGHRAALSPHLQAAGARLRTLFSARPLDSPSRKELAADAVSQQALRFLLETGEAIELSPEVVLGAEAYGHAVDEIKAHLAKCGQATVSELRQVLGSSRRVVVPLLEKLDREGITRREGDVRVLGRSG